MTSAANHAECSGRLLPYHEALDDNRNWIYPTATAANGDNVSIGESVLEGRLREEIRLLRAGGDVGKREGGGGVGDSEDETRAGTVLMLAHEGFTAEAHGPLRNVLGELSHEETSRRWQSR